MSYNVVSLLKSTTVFQGVLIERGLPYIFQGSWFQGSWSCQYCVLLAYVNVLLQKFYFFFFSSWNLVSSLLLPEPIWRQWERRPSNGGSDIHPLRTSTSLLHTLLYIYSTYIHVHTTNHSMRCLKRQLATQHNLPKAVIFSKKNWPPQVGLNPTTLRF